MSKNIKEFETFMTESFGSGNYTSVDQFMADPHVAAMVASADAQGINAEITEAMTYALSTEVSGMGVVTLTVQIGGVVYLQVDAFGYDPLMAPDLEISDAKQQMEACVDFLKNAGL
jgi:hypothetical protein